MLDIEHAFDFGRAWIFELDVNHPNFVYYGADSVKSVEDLYTNKSTTTPGNCINI